MRASSRQFAPVLGLNRPFCRFRERLAARERLDRQPPAVGDDLIVQIDRGCGVAGSVGALEERQAAAGRALVGE